MKRNRKTSYTVIAVTHYADGNKEATTRRARKGGTIRQMVPNTVMIQDCAKCKQICPLWKRRAFGHWTEHILFQGQYDWSYYVNSVHHITAHLSHRCSCTTLVTNKNISFDKTHKPMYGSMSNLITWWCSDAEGNGVIWQDKMASVKTS